MSIPMVNLAALVMLLLYSTYPCVSGDASRISWVAMLRQCFPDTSASCRGICPLREFLEQLMIFFIAKFCMFQPKSKHCFSTNANFQLMAPHKHHTPDGFWLCKMHRSMIQIRWPYLPCLLFDIQPAGTSLFWASVIKTKIVTPP